MMQSEALTLKINYVLIKKKVNFHNLKCCNIQGDDDDLKISTHTHTHTE